MFKVKQLFTKNFRLLLHNTLFLVYLNSLEVFRSQNFEVSKSYQNNEVTSITKLLGAADSFSLYHEITWSNI